MNKPKSKILLVVSLLYLFASPWAGADPNDLETRASRGEANAQIDLGKQYNDRGDYTKAMEWWRKAADQGNPRACYNIGALYTNGQGVQKDLGEAEKWFQKSVDGGFTRAEPILKQIREGGYAQAQYYIKKLNDEKQAAALLKEQKRKDVINYTILGLVAAVLGWGLIKLGGKFTSTLPSGNTALVRPFVRELKRYLCYLLLSAFLNGINHFAFSGGWFFTPLLAKNGSCSIPKD